MRGLGIKDEKDRKIKTWNLERIMGKALRDAKHRNYSKEGTQKEALL
jgi:hypothetical protein